MRKFILSLLVIVCMISSIANLVMAQQTSEDDARAVATNWISAIIAKKGSWANAKRATVEEITPFSRRGHQVGYFCKVHPTGYIIVPLRKEMAPVKAYSAKSEIDPLSEEGLADLLKGNMERILGKIQEAEQQQMKHFGALSVPADLLEIDYRSAWEALKEGDLETIITVPPPAEGGQVFEQGETLDGTSELEALNYQEGEVLLSSDWHQTTPYNNDCPDYGCATTSNGRALVGCVATAGAQIMRYWSWPPWGETTGYTDPYDWVNMPDNATTASSAEVQAAVAELSHEIGVAVNMSYGCEASSAYTYNMASVYEQFYRYSSTINVDGASRVNRWEYTANYWFDMMKNEFNSNRPVQYRITGHSIVGDGWQTIGVINEYHMNYGWFGPGSDTWYTIDSMTANPENDEYMIKDIIPSTYLVSLSGTYPKESFPYRYIYKDTIGGNGIFAGGQFIQFLPGVSIESVNYTIHFYNSTSDNTHLFTRGDINRGIIMPQNSISGAIKMYPNGKIRLF